MDDFYFDDSRCLVDLSKTFFFSIYKIYYMYLVLHVYCDNFLVSTSPFVLWGNVLSGICCSRVNRALHLGKYWLQICLKNVKLLSWLYFISQGTLNSWDTLTILHSERPKLYAIGLKLHCSSVHPSTCSTNLVSAMILKLFQQTWWNFTER